MAHRVRPCESGCPVLGEQLLPVLVVWAPPRKKRDQEQHALHGNTSAAGSPPRSVQQRVDLANDDDLEPTLMLPATAPGAAAHGPGRPHTDLEARLERLFTRGRELAGTLTRPEVDILEMGIVAATEAHRRHILTMVPDWHKRPVNNMQLALGVLAVYNLGPSEYTPVEEVNILRALEGGLHIRRRRWRWKVSSVNWGAPRGETVTRSCVEWWLLGCLAEWRTTPQWMRSGSSTSVRPHPPWNPPRDRADDGPWVPVDTAGGEGRHQMFRRDAERPLRETSRRELP